MSPPGWAVASIDFIDAVCVDWAYHFPLQPIPGLRWRLSDEPNELETHIDFAGRDFTARLTKARDDDALDRLRLTLYFPEMVPLRTVRETFNLFTEANTDMAKPEYIVDPECGPPRICLVGVKAEVAVESLTARTLRALLVDLIAAADGVEKQLEGHGVDHWDVAGGGEEHETGDSAAIVFDDWPDADE